MATKSSTKKTKTKHDLLYIMSNSCGWCKKSDPIVDELISEGHKIKKLDVMIPDEAKIANDAKSTHGAQCGTPLFLDNETGNQVCGFREKDVIEKWAKGEEIPKPPQPKTPPPTPPQNLEDQTQVSEFKTAYEKWVKENDHMPKLLPFDDVLNRMRQARAAQAQQGAPGAPGAPVPSQVNPDPSIKKTMDYYYIIENNDRQAVVADTQYINGLKQQYYYREPNGYLTKVVGDTNWNKTKPLVNNPPNVDNVGKSRTAPGGVARQNLSKGIADGVVEVKRGSGEKMAEKKLKENKKSKVAKKAVTDKKSKTNKKTIESF